MTFALTFAYALLMNVIPVVEVIWSGRSPGALLFMYWVETALTIVTGSIRIIAHRRATGKTGHHLDSSRVNDHKSTVAALYSELGGPNTFLKSYLAITVIFTVVHGAFIGLLVFLFRIAPVPTAADLQLAVGWAFALQFFWLSADLPRLSGWAFRELQNSVGDAALRVLVTQIGLIFGLAATAMTGSPWGLIGVFIGFRSLLDAGVAWMRGLMKHADLPSGLARFLSRRSKQSVDELEAEFDAMKKGGAEVEAMLERPIGEVRPDRARPIGPRTVRSGRPRAARRRH